MSYWALFIAGLTDSYNPCSIGVLLITLTILFGLGKRNLIALFGFTYLITIFVTYLLIGVGIFHAFHLFGIHGFFGYAAGIILIIVGLGHLLPKLAKYIPPLEWLNRCRIPLNIDKHLEKGVFLGGIILGFLIGLCTVPCAGGIYLGAIGLLATANNYWRGLTGILIFNIGFIIPLLIIFILASREKFLKLIQKVTVRLVHFSTYSIAIIMILLGIALIYFTMPR